MRELWYKRIYNHCQLKCRTSTHDSLICEAIERNQIKLSKSTYIFGHGTTRENDSRLADFIHGSCTSFENFNFTLGIQTNKVCRYCESAYDSPEHQLFDCSALEDPSMQNLKLLVDQPSNYISEILFDGNKYLHSLLYDRIAYIDTIKLDC